MPTLVLLNGGPRVDGNTVRLAEWVAAGARAAGAEVETIHLADRRIETCRGCEACGHTGRCWIDDDLETVCRALDKADGVIVCSPIYAGWYASVLKTFVDRLATTIGFTGRFSHLCSVGVTTAKYDFRTKIAKEIASSAITSSWTRPGYVTGYLHKSVIDRRRSEFLELSAANSPRLYAAAHRMGEKLVGDIAAGRRGRLPLVVRWVFRRFVLPGIGRVLLNHRDRAAFLLRALEEHGVINPRWRAKHARRMTEVSEEATPRATERIVFRR